MIKYYYETSFIFVQFSNSSCTIWWDPWLLISSIKCWLGVEWQIEQNKHFQTTQRSYVISPHKRGGKWPTTITLPRAPIDPLDDTMTQKPRASSDADQQSVGNAG